MIDIFSREQVIAILGQYKRTIESCIPGALIGDETAQIDGCIHVMSVAQPMARITRCRDCKYYSAEWQECCYNSRTLGHPMHPDGFCHRGRDKDE